MEFLEHKFKFDSKVYEHFRQKFDQKVVSFGSVKMSYFVMQLKEINKYIEKKCIEEVEETRTFKTIKTR